MLAAVLLDDSLWEKVPEVRRQEWRLSIRELLDDHAFSVEATPLVLRLGFSDEAVSLKWEVPGDSTVADVRIERAQLSRHLEEYVRLCREMMALPEGGAAVKLPALDKAKKEAHDAAATLLQELNDAVRPSHDTARRMFTLLVTLLVDTTSLSVLKRPHQEG